MFFFFFFFVWVCVLNFRTRKNQNLCMYNSYYNIVCVVSFYERLRINGHRHTDLKPLRGLRTAIRKYNSLRVLPCTCPRRCFRSICVIFIGHYTKYKLLPWTTIFFADMYNLTYYITHTLFGIPFMYLFVSMCVSVRYIQYIY